MSKESDIRSAAAALHDAIAAGRNAGLVVNWPSNADGLLAIEISETGRAATTVTVDTAEGVAPATAAKAATAAQKAVDRVIETDATKK